MNDYIEKRNQIIELINGAEDIAIMPAKVSGIDAFSAGVGLYLTLKDEGKNVTMIYPGVTPEDFGNTEGLDIISNPGQRELLVSVDYSNTEASKVNYSTDDDVLHFSISPVGRDFDLSRVRSEIRGMNFDLIITIGAQITGDLGKAFEDVGGEYGQADILNIDNTDKNQRFGNINIVDSNIESLSLMVLNLVAGLGFRVSRKSAESLLKGISLRKGI